MLQSKIDRCDTVSDFDLVDFCPRMDDEPLSDAGESIHGHALAVRLGHVLVGT